MSGNLSHNNWGDNEGTLLAGLIQRMDSWIGEPRRTPDHINQDVGINGGDHGAL
jgi:hypothetical protein